MNCIFCQIVSGQMPSFKVYEDESHLAFLTIFPNTDGLTVLIPKEHCRSDFKEVQSAILMSLTQTAQKMAQQICRAFEDVARCGLVCEGEAVDHLHFKIIPLHGTENGSQDLRSFKKETDYQFFATYPGYISTLEPTAMADKNHLEKIAIQIREA